MRTKNSDAGRVVGQYRWVLTGAAGLSVLMAAAAAPSPDGTVRPSPAPVEPVVTEREDPMHSRITIPNGQAHRVDASLTIEVIEIVEKRLLSGDGMMRVRLRLVTPDGAELLEFTSQEPVRRWRDLNLRYLGGWRSEVQLEIERVPP